jgi:glycosyltransferase involved in cell wall biosynthesis
MNLAVDARWLGPHGIGRYAKEVFARLPNPRAMALSLPTLHPLDTIELSARLWLERPDVFFSPGFNPPISSPCPFVFTIHDLIHLHVPGESGRFKRAYYNFVVRPAAHRARAVLTDSEFSRQQILEWSGLPAERVKVVWCGVNQIFSPLGQVHNPGFPYLFTVVNDKSHKNFSGLLEVFARSGLARDIKLIVNRKPDLWAARVAELGLEGRVVFQGLIPDDLLPSFYRGATAFVFPSLYEGFGLPPLEAMACGVPVLTSNRTSIPEVVGAAGVLIDPQDLEVFAGELRRIVVDSDLRQKLVLAGPARAKMFTWDRTAALVRSALEV